MADLVLAACLSNQAYDPQCEGHRAHWLYQLFVGTPQQATIAAGIIAALDQPDEALISNLYCITQLCELASLLAQAGDMGMADALRRFIWQQRFTQDDQPGGLRAIVALDGMPALVEIMRRQGQLLLEHPDAAIHTLDDLTEHTSWYQPGRLELVHLAQRDAAFAAYLAHQVADEAACAAAEAQTDEDRAASRLARYQTVRAEWPPVRLFALAASDETLRRGRFRQFGHCYDAEDRELILRQLAGETDQLTITRLLWVFAHIEPAWLPEPIWEWADSDDDDLSAAAYGVLANVCDERVGEFARSHLRGGAINTKNDALFRLFVRNLRGGDVALILAALGSLQLNADEAHAFGSNILDILDANPGVELAPLARWVYHSNACSLCRHGAIKQMLDRNRLPDDIAAEARFDADPDTAALMDSMLTDGSPSH